MGIDWKAAAGLLVIVGAVLGTVLVLSFGHASSGEGGAQYEVTVKFSAAVTQDDIEEADALLRTFDDDLEFLLMENFPPIGSAVVATEGSDFCQTVETDLAGRSYVLDVSCQAWAGGGGANSDAPVSTDNDAE